MPVSFHPFFTPICNCSWNVYYSLMLIDILHIHPENVKVFAETTHEKNVVLIFKKLCNFFPPYINFRKVRALKMVQSLVVGHLNIKFDDAHIVIFYEIQQS